MLPNKEAQTKKTFYNLHNQTRVLSQFDACIQSPDTNNVKALIDWIEIELYEQFTRIREADVGYLLREIIHGISLIEITNEQHKTNELSLCDEFKLYTYFECIMNNKSDLLNNAPITCSLIDRITIFLKEPHV